MTVSASSAVGSVSQGSYTPKPQAEPVAAPEPEVVSKVAEVQSPSENKSDNSKNDGREGRDSEASMETIKQAVSDINKRANGTEAVFGIHDKTNRVTIKIVDKESKEVIKELPAEKTLDLIAKAWEMAGLMVDEKR